MGGPRTTALLGIVAIGAVSLFGCGSAPDTPVPGHSGATKFSADARAARRAYDGAPPVMPHEDFGIECSGCHAEEGMEVADIGFAPALPHGDTLGMSDDSRCRQCHVLAIEDGVFAENAFVGLAQDLRRGTRQYPGAPPTIPHPVFMRENCAACHDGPAAREEIRCSHPERVQCLQCHLRVSETRHDALATEPFTR